MVRRSVALEVGGFEEEFREAFEDQVFFSKLFVATPTFLSDRSTSRYRQHPASACAQSASRRRRSRARLVFLFWLLKHAFRTAGAPMSLRLNVLRKIATNAVFAVV
jgi:hypothetical protein